MVSSSSVVTTPSALLGSTLLLLKVLVVFTVHSRFLVEAQQTFISPFSHKIHRRAHTPHGDYSSHGYNGDIDSLNILQRKKQQQQKSGAGECADDQNRAAPRKSICAVDRCTVVVPRGGSLQKRRHDKGEEVSSGVVIRKVRNIIRSLLEVGDKKSPAVSTIVRRALGLLEDLMGIKLLPITSEKKSKKIKKKKKKQIAEKKTIAADTEDATANGTLTSKRKKKKSTVSKSESKKMKVPSSTKTKTKSKSPQRKKAPPTSTMTSAHVARDIKATNPNYRIQRELKAFIASPPPNLSVAVGKNIRVWIVTLTGPPNTVYEGERYRLKVTFPPAYPTTPPSVFFLQPTPRHEHVYTNGDICLSLLGKDWRPTMTAQSIAMSILSILSGAQQKSMPMDNARHAVNKPGQPQDDWVYHDDNC